MSDSPAPSPEALAFAADVVATTLGGHYIVGLQLRSLARQFDHYATQAVAAERARIITALESTKAKPAWEGSQEMPDPDGLHPAYWDGADSAFDEAVEIVKGSNQ